MFKRIALFTLILATAFSAALANRAGAQSVHPQISSMMRELTRIEQEIRRTQQALEQKGAQAVAAEALLADAEKQHADRLTEQDAKGISAVSFDDVLRLLQTQKVELAIQLAGVEARRDFLVKQIDESRHAAATPIVQQIESMLTMQQESLQKARELAQRGYVNSDEVRAAEKELLELEIRLSEARNGEASPVRQSLEQNLMETSLQQVELAARRSIVENLLQEYAAARRSILQSEELESKADRQRVVIDKLHDQIQGLESRLVQLLANQADISDMIKSSETESESPSKGPDQ